MILFVSMTFLLMVVADGGPDTCQASPLEGACSSGCWKDLFRAVTTTCEPVGRGFFSPANDDQRYPCPAGTFSTDGTICYSCPVGTFAPEAGSSRCLVCPTGSYSRKSGAVQCEICDPLYYKGEGSDYAATEGSENILFCVPPIHLPDNDGDDEASDHPIFSTQFPSSGEGLHSTTAPSAGVPNGPSPENLVESASKWIVFAIIGLAGLIALLGVFNVILRRRVLKGAPVESNTDHGENALNCHDSTTVKSNDSKVLSTQSGREINVRLERSYNVYLDRNGNVSSSIGGYGMDGNDDNELESTCSTFRGVYLNESGMSRSPGIEFGYDSDSQNDLDDQYNITGYGCRSVWSFPAACSVQCHENKDEDDDFINVDINQ